MTQTGRKQYQCYICDKICLNISSLKLHMMMHTVDNSYKYSFCEIAFLHTSAIKIHMKVHLELKQYQCNSSDNNTDLTYTGNKVYLKSQCEKKLKSTTGNNYQIHFNNLFIELKLPLQCGRTVTSNGNCFYDSVIALLEDPNISLGITSPAKDITNYRELCLFSTKIANYTLIIIVYILRFQTLNIQKNNIQTL